MWRVQMLDDATLEDYMVTFYGYGNYSGDYWFIGKEEGGGETIEDNLARIQAWQDMGKNEIEDLFEYHDRINEQRWFGEFPPSQSTWRQLIRFLIVSKSGHLANISEIRKYQGTKLGRRQGETCLLELLPLPSRSTGKWLYADRSDLHYLKSREGYREEVVGPRVIHIQERIQQYKPKIVLFYSTSAWYVEKWKAIADVRFMELNNGEFQIGQNDNTVFMITKHSTAFGNMNEHFEKAGTLVRSWINDA